MMQHSPLYAKMRLDELLVSRDLVDSRAQAKALILSGKVRLGTTILDKPGKLLPIDSPLHIETPPRFVSRGGEKLASFLEAYPEVAKGRHVLDIGASTGGFTDCLLQHGALTSTCVDVGYGQLHFKLRNDPRVSNIERVNARRLDKESLPRVCYDRIVMDLSFISLRKVLPAAWPLLEPEGLLIALFKPQFEAKKSEVSKGRGIIRDPAIHKRLLAECRTFVCDVLPDCVLYGEAPSLIKGTDGNQEFFFALKKSKGLDSLDNM